jgi:ribonuclease HI
VTGFGEVRVTGRLGRSLLAWTDGGGDCSPETEAYVGVLVRDGDTGEVLWEHGECIGKATHNEAEYRAVLAAVGYAVESGAASLLVRSDSRVVVNQINGGFRVNKPHLAARLEEVRGAARGLDFRIEHVPRGENREADALTWRARPRR